MKVMELTAPPPKKTKPSADEKKKASFSGSSTSGLRQPLQLTPQRRFSHAGFGMHQSHAGQQDNVVIPKRKISLFHNMKFTNPILEEQAAAAAAAEQQKKEFGLNPNAPSFNMQQYAHSHPRGRRSVQYMPMEAPMMMMQPVLVNPPRRLSAVAGGHAELAVSGLALPPNVLRLPRGPDKGKGFQRWCKSRMTHPSESTTATTPAAREIQKQNQNPPTPQRKSRAIPIVAPPAADDSKVGGADVQDLVRGAASLSVSSDEATPAPVAAVAPAPVIAAPAPAAVPAAVVAAANNNLIVNLESSDSDEGHFSDHDLEDNERSR